MAPIPVSHNGAPKGHKPRVGMYFRAYVNIPKIGSGHRFFLIVRMGRKWIYAFNKPSMALHRFSYSDWRMLRPDICTLDLEAYTHSVCADVRVCEADGRGYSRRGVRDVVRLNKQAQAMQENPHG